MKKLIAVLLALTLLALSASCGGGGEQADPVSQEGGLSDTIIVAEPGDAKFLSPFMDLGSIEGRYMAPVYESLLTTTADGSEYVGVLATSWEMADDGMSWTFQLVPDLKFSDGSEVTLEDWQFSMYTARDSTTSNGADRAAAIDTVEMPEKDVLVINLKEPSPPFLSNMSSGYTVLVSKSHYETVGEEEFQQNPLGTGPYMVIDRVLNEYTMYEANPYYRFADQGLPKTKYVKYVTTTDDNTRLLQLQAGDIDIAPGMPLSMGEALRTSNGVTAATFTSAQMRHMLINVTKEPFDNILVREALRYLTDKQEIVDIAAFGMGFPSASSVPTAHGDFLDKTITDPAVDIDKAKELLTEAGYPDGFECTISISGAQQVYIDIATVLKSQWEKGGITLNIDAMEGGALTDLFQSLGHEITLLQWTDGGSDPSSLLGFICHYPDSYNWYTGLNSSKLQELFDQSQVEIDHDKRVAIVHEIQQEVYKQHCIIPLFTAEYCYGVSEKIHDLKVSTGNYMYLQDITKDL